MKAPERAASLLGLWLSAWLMGCGQAQPSAALTPELGQPGANLLLLVVDTLRADILSSYGGSAQTSPVLERMAAQGVQFESCRASSPWTLPSMGSILTGLYPRSHGAQLRGLERCMNRRPRGKYGPAAPIPLEGRRANKLADGVDTLASTLAQGGYSTYLRSTNPFYKYGLSQGYERYRPGPAGAREVVDWGLEQLDRHDPSKPFFMTLHFIDVHTTKMGVEDLQQDLSLFEAEGRPALEVGLRNWARYSDAREEFEPLLADRKRMYLGCMRYIDRQLGRLFSSIDEMNMGELIVAFTSDHGEDFRDHWDVDQASGHTDPRRQWKAALGVGHGHNLHASLTHVPLILWGSGLPVGLRIKQTVGLVDILPTLCQLLGVAPTGTLDGRSLVPLMAGARVDPIPYISESMAYGREKTAYFAPDGFLLIQPESALERAQLFDLAADPLEQADLQTEHTLQAQALLGDLRRFEAGLALREGQEHVDDAEALEHLRDLGYVGDDE